MDASFAFVTREDILNFPFPYKLWLVVNLEYCDFLRWNRDGTVVLLDLVALEEYLNSGRSIFKIKNSSSFLKHLVEFKFDRLNSTPEAEEDVLLQYKNENFKRHRLDLLAKIRRHTYQLIGEIPTDNSKECYENATSSCANVHDQCRSIPKLVSERMLGDLCFMCHGGLSNIKKSRLHFQTTLHFNNEKRILKEKLDASESANRCKSNPDICSRSISEEDQVIELPVELFENPHDSVLNFDFLPEYAGYYGNCTKDHILHFFGEYLPMYEDGSMEVKRIAADNTSSGNNSLSINTETNIAQYHSPNTSVNSNVIISTPVELNTMCNLNFSSNLEPIFINGNCENININSMNDSGFTVTYLNSNSLSNDDDISMEEFLKFKDSRSENVSVSNQQITGENYAFYNSDHQEQDKKTFPQMPASFKMELNEDLKENEANFRDFFSQYRASLNLLYDRQ